MNITEFLTYLTGCCGITFIIVHSEIMSMLGIRQLLHKSLFFKKLTSCSLCTGAWVGVALSPIPLEISKTYILTVGAASAASFLFERLTILMDEKIIKYEKEKKD